VTTGGSGPLDNLPRPLSERDRGAGWRHRRASAVLIAGVIAAVGVAIATSVSSGPLTPVGAVQGAVESTPPPSVRPTLAAGAPDPGASARPPSVAAPSPSVAPTAPPPSTLTGYRWPLPRGRLTLPFGPSPWGSRIVDGEPFHDGIDLATFCGDRIVAAHGGTVLAAGRKYDRFMGWVGDLQPYLDRLEKKHLWTTLPIVVVIDDGNGYRSVYAHFGKVVVKKGKVVKAGQLLGYEGRTGRASGCHLHYGLFSPDEVATFGIDAKVVKRMKLPDRQIARIDPMLVIGERPKAPKPKPSASPGT
jgi:murein DD-endopeptidase MepM/ murein hydrolase activator NlpD